MWTGRFFSGVATQRSPLRGVSTRLEEAYTGTRGDEMLSGSNTEISPKLTLIRRPGLSQYNSNSLPAVNRFYGFRNLIGGTAFIKVLADHAPQAPSPYGTVRDITGPSNNITLWSKTLNSGITSFQSVGNTLYASDLTTAHKYLLSPMTWAANTTFSQDQFVVDSNNNLQLNIGGQTASIVNIQIAANVVTLFFNPTTPLTVPLGTSLTLSGLTTVPALNGQTLTVATASNTLQITASFTHSPVLYQPETGSATTGNGVTGSTPPAWLTTLGAVTVDGGAQWENRGSAIQNWGITPPDTAPTVTQVSAPSVYPPWAPNTWYAPLFVITASGANLFQMTSPAAPASGVTGGSPPVSWNTATPGVSTTTDGTVTWLYMGPSAWQSGHAYAVGDVVQPTFTYYITTTTVIPTCFSLNTRIAGEKPIGEIEVNDLVWNGNRYVRVAAIRDHEYDGDLCHMGNDEWVTPDHLMKSGENWVPASEIFKERKHFVTTVRTLSMDATEYEDQCFVLANGHIAHNKQQGGTIVDQQEVTATCLFQCTQAGTSGTVAPGWTNGLGTVVNGDGGVNWVNRGTAPAWPGATQTLTLTTQILDSNKNLQTVQTIGESGATPPVWLTTAGSTTLDNTTTWLFSGAFGSANTGPWIYAYSGENSISGAISTSSPESQPITQNIGQQVVVQGAGFADTQVDTIVIWRTVQGGSTLFYLGAIPNPSVTASATSFYIASNVAYVNAPNTFSAGQSVYLQSFGAGSYFNRETVVLLAASPTQYSFAFTHADVGSVGTPVADTTGTATFAGTWIYTDTTPDTSLNIFIQAPIDFTNNPPPVGLQALTYHLQRVWGAVANLVYYSDGPDVISGNGNEAWSPGNVFAYPETVIRLLPTSSGLYVFTLSDIYIIQGLGTASSPLTSLSFLQDIGISSYDAFDINGSIVYAYTSDNQILCMDPSSGVSEIGFAIGDQFGPGNGTGTFTPTSTRLAWHIAGSKDKGLYVSDFLGNWWRMSPTPSPETGVTWSPMANFLPTTGGFSAVQSIETLPGTHLLLVGPPSSPSGSLGPILKRDYSVHKDNGVAYAANAVIGSLVLAQPGQVALVESLTTDSVAAGTPLSLSVQLDEIAPVSAGYFEGLQSYVPDPTELSPSLSLYAQRFYLSQTQQPALCRHLQVRVDFGMDAVQNELLSMTLFGGFEQEK